MSELAKNVAYHATFNAYLPSIRAHGLGNSRYMASNWDCSYKWNADVPGDCVYLAKTKEEALGFVECTEDDQVSDEVYLTGFTLLEINLDELDESLLGADPNLKDTEESAYLYRGVVPSSAVLREILV